MREERGHEFESRQLRSGDGDLMRNNTATCNLMMVDDWCGYRVKIIFFAILNIVFCFSDPVLKSLPSAL